MNTGCPHPKGQGPGPGPQGFLWRCLGLCRGHPLSLQASGVQPSGQIHTHHPAWNLTFGWAGPISPGCLADKGEHPQRGPMAVSPGWAGGGSSMVRCPARPGPLHTRVSESKASRKQGFCGCSWASEAETKQLAGGHSGDVKGQFGLGSGKDRAGLRGGAVGRRAPAWTAGQGGCTPVLRGGQEAPTPAWARTGASQPWRRRGRCPPSHTHSRLLPHLGSRHSFLLTKCTSLQTTRDSAIRRMGGASRRCRPQAPQGVGAAGGGWGGGQVSHPRTGGWGCWVRRRTLLSRNLGWGLERHCSRDQLAGPDCAGQGGHLHAPHGRKQAATPRSLMSNCFITS